MTHKQLAQVTSGMTTARWMALPWVVFPVCLMRPIQDDDGEPSGRRGDPLVHLVYAEGAFWIEDGHHRYYRARERGQRLLRVRVFGFPQLRH